MAAQALPGGEPVAGPSQLYPYPPPYARQDAPGATPSMVLGIIALVFLPLGCCCGVGWLVVVPLGIAAIALGFSARSKATASRGMLGGGGKALSGIVTGGTAIGIAAVLFALELIFRVGSGTFFNVFVTPSP